MQLEEELQEYFQKSEEVIAVYLFGSYGAGKEKSGSDVDLGILVDFDHPAWSSDKTDEYIVSLGRIVRKDIHPVILNSAGEELLRQVFTKWQCIVVNDTRKLSRFKMLMFARIADFGHYRAQMQSGLIRRVLED